MLTTENITTNLQAEYLRKLYGLLYQATRTRNWAVCFALVGLISRVELRSDVPGYALEGSRGWELNPWRRSLT